MNAVTVWWESGIFPRSSVNALADSDRLSSFSDEMSSASGAFWYSALNADSPRSIRRFHACCIAVSSSSCFRSGHATREPVSIVA